MLPGNPRKVSNHSRDPSVAPAPQRGREGSPTTASLVTLESLQDHRLLPRLWLLLGDAPRRSLPRPEGKVPAEEIDSRVCPPCKGASGAASPHPRGQQGGREGTRLLS